MVSYTNLKTYTGREIEDWGGIVSDDYKSFQTKYKNFLKKICKKNGYELVNFLPGHYQFSCFIKGNDKFVYVSISDVRYFKNAWFDVILIRTAANEKDYRGGRNNYTTLIFLEDTIKDMLA